MDKDFLDQKSDEWLVAALLSEDEDLRNAVASFIMETHGPDLERYLRKKLPRVWADQALSEVWAGFYQTLQRQGVRESIGQLLGSISKNKRSDTVDVMQRETQFEADIPYELAGLEQVEESVELGELATYLLGLPYEDSVLTSCERIVWALEKQYQFPRDVISRILGKSRDTLNTHFSNAKKRILQRVMSDEYMPRYWHDNPFMIRDPHFSDSAVIIENFGSWFLPRLTPEEIKPLGLPKVELERNFGAMLMVPRWKKGGGSNTEYGKLSLLLVRQETQDQWSKEVGRIKRHPEANRFRFPEACLVDLDVDNGYIDLSVQTLVELWPDLDPPEHSDNTYLAVHNVPVLVPIMLGTWDPGLYFDPDVNDGGTAYDRWPFLPTDEDWGSSDFYSPV